jgi:uncharacterized protein (TIGR02118 family)
MVRVLVLYPRGEGKKFDFDYYRDHHMPLVKERLAPLKVEIDFGIPSPGRPSPYIAVTHMIFESWEQLSSRYGAAAQELLADRLRFTDIETVFQISEVMEV